MFSVSLKGARFTVPVGLYSQETVLLNELEIDVTVQQKAVIADLPFMDYVQLHTLVQEQIAKPTPLLETHLQQIVLAIEAIYPLAQIKVTIRKLNPPMMGKVAYSEVTWEQ